MTVITSEHKCGFILGLRRADLLNSPAVHPHHASAYVLVIFLQDMEVFVKTRQGSAPLPSLNELAFAQDWSIISKAIERRLSNLSLELSQSIANYVVKGPGGVGVSTGQIPTSLLLASVNTPDHRGFVASLESDTDISTARGIIAAIYSQLYSSTEPFSSHLKKNSPIRKPTLDLPTSLKSTFLAVSQWYNMCVLADSSQPLEKITVSAMDGNQSESSNKKRVSKVSGGMSANQRPKPRKPLLPQTNNHPTETVMLKQKAAVTPSHCHRKSTLHQRKSAMQKKDEVSTTPAAPAVSKRLSMPVSKSSSVGAANSSILRPLVIIIPAIETISFAENCPPGRQRMFGALPIRFVFGLSSAADLGLEVRCDATTLSRLAIKRFKTPPPSVFLQAALTEMIHTPGFRMSRAVLNFAIDSVYMCVDYSIENFLKRVKACMLSHYQNLRHPQLLQALDTASTYILNLNHEELIELASTYPSVAEISSEGTADTLGDRLIEYLKSHWLCQLLLPRIFSWVLALFACLEIRPVASTLPDLYRNWLSGDLSTSPGFSQTLSLFKVLNKTRVIAAVDSSLGSLMASIGLLSSVKSNSDPTVSADSVDRNALPGAVGVLSLNDARYKTILPDAITILMQLKKAVASWRTRLLEASEDPLSDAAADCTSSPSSCALLPGKRLTLQALRERLRNSPVRTEGKTLPGCSKTPWKQALEEFAAWLTAVLTPRQSQLPFEESEVSLACLLAPHHVPLYEVFYGPPPSDVAALRCRLDPPMQRVVHQVLTNPGAHLKCAELCLMSPDDLDPQLPDLCILYKLYLEAGKLINLYDWLVAFATVVGDPSNSRTLNEIPSQWMQARFLRGVSELEHLGFIKGTRRRIDHVSRLRSAYFLN
ncbi:hypothetical protein AAHC03_025863 [Spirometra sp. Aus1]